jgi:cation diffusion facilitator family transporter
MPGSKNINSKIRIQSLVLIIGILLMFGKFIAYLITHSNAILTDALESIINVVAGSFGLYSLFLASKPKDDDHPYGHGKIEFISASIEGILIVLAGLAIIGKSTFNLFCPSEIHKIDIGIWIIGISGAINFIIGEIAEIKGKNSDSITLVASGKHLKSDAYTTIGILFGLLLIYFTKIIWIDNIVAIACGIWIIYSGYKILKESVGGIMDEADFTLLEKISANLEKHRKPNWIDIHNLRTIKYGDKLHIDCHVTLPFYFSVKDGHNEIDKMEQLIDQVFEKKVEIFIHVDPCNPDFSCSICLKSDCNERKIAFDKKIKWNLENTMQNSKHGKINEIMK